jgi:HSP20 family protein
LDLHENVEANTVAATFELPGLTKESVHVHDGRLRISGERKISADQEESGYTVRERRYGKFSRTLQPPYGVKVSKTVSFGMVNVISYL